MKHECLGCERKGAIFGLEDGRILLSELFGISCGDCGADGGPATTRGMAIVSTSLGRFEADGLALAEAKFDTDAAWIVWRMNAAALRLDSQWSRHRATGVLSRRDRLTNEGNAAVTVFRCLARFAFPPGAYEAYAQDSRWCNENQGAWTPLRTGAFVLSCEPGRTTQGGTPYACLREIGANIGLGFHILPVGNWTIRITAHAVANAPPFAVVELGLADEDLRLQLAPGESFELPEILIQELPDDLGTDRQSIR